MSHVLFVWVLLVLFVLGLLLFFPCLCFCGQSQIRLHAWKRIMMPLNSLSSVTHTETMTPLYICFKKSETTPLYAISKTRFCVWHFVPSSLLIFRWYNQSEYIIFWDIMQNIFSIVYRKHEMDIENKRTNTDLFYVAYIVGKMLLPIRFRREILILS